MSRAWPLLQLAVPLLGLNALLTLVNPGPSPWPQLTARIAPELCIALLLAAAWATWRGRLPPRLLRTLAAACTVLAVVRLAEITSAALYGRTLHVYWDGRHLGQVLADQGAARWQVAAGAGALALACWLLYRLLLASWRMLASALTVRPLRHAAQGASVLLLALFAAHGVQGLDRHRWFAGSITPVLARQLALTALLLPRDAAAERLTPSPAWDSDLAGLHGADVLLLFSESYGVSTLDRPAQDAALAAPRAALADAIAASGRWAVSARVRSPTFAGASWLAHGALLTGVDTRDPLDYELLLSSQRRTLVQHFGAQGWRTVGWMPGLQRDWPEGRFFGFDRIADARSIGYTGPLFGPARLPDQAAMALLHAQELAAPQPRAPRFVVFPTLDSHAPFRPLAPFVADWTRLAGPAPYTAPQLAVALDEPVSLRTPVPAYVQSIAGTWAWLGDYLQRLAPPGLVAIVLGDHQAFPGVSGEQGSWDVPVHVIAHDPQLRQRLLDAGFGAGLAPRGPALADMHGLTPLLLRAFAGSAGGLPSPAANQPVAATPPCSPACRPSPNTSPARS
ncbi:hypothetical protein [Pseudorhodoferax sp. Leaf265]|uniref:hypothetical protein n=1 Tax=Pseudorhodoferax sp. Leaf265 TaxID=1736315 RepID=UPI0006F35E29|nr:hypothetical protein [Pseudorhodoferax sp. Leaf265]KQP06286.1 hypothetical protein ASF45_09425 [Pseudorhodoferax sp. Leaf265]